MKNHHIFLLRALGLLVVILVFAPTAALCYDVYSGGYDSYTGSYGSYGVDYDNSAWTPNTPSYTDSSGSSGSSGSGSTGSGSSGSLPAGINATTKVDFKDTNGSGYGAVFYNSSGALESRALADWTKRLVYVKSGSKPDYTKVVGDVRAINWITAGYEGSTGYIDVSALEKYLAPAAPAPTPAASSGSNYASSAPTGARLVTISNGYIYDANTKAEIDYAMPEASSGKIYNRESSAEIGKMLSATTGYLNEYTNVSSGSSVRSSDDTGDSDSVEPQPAATTPASGPSSGGVVKSNVSSVTKATVTTNVVAKATPTSVTVGSAFGTQAPAAATAVSPVEVENLNKSIPAGAELVFVVGTDSGYVVYDKETGVQVPEAYYSAQNKNIYYGNSDQIYGKVLANNFGYVDNSIFDGANEQTTAAASDTANTNTEAPVVNSNPNTSTTNVGAAVSNLVKSVVGVFTELFKSLFSMFKK